MSQATPRLEPQRVTSGGVRREARSTHCGSLQSARTSGGPLDWNDGLQQQAHIPSHLTASGTTPKHRNNLFQSKLTTEHRIGGLTKQPISGLHACLQRVERVQRNVHRYTSKPWIGRPVSFWKLAAEMKHHAKCIQRHRPDEKDTKTGGSSPNCRFLSGLCHVVHSKSLVVCFGKARSPPASSVLFAQTRGSKAALLHQAVAPTSCQPSFTGPICNPTCVPGSSCTGNAVGATGS